MRFLDREGRYWGPPPDDRTAAAELERLQSAGASAIAFVWKSFWMLEHFPRFADHLDGGCSRTLDNDRLKVFSLN